MPKAKPVSLHPLNFDDAVKALIRVDNKRISRSSKRATKANVKKTNKDNQYHDE